MRKIKAHTISSRILYSLIALTAVIFTGFYTIGYDTPFEDNPQFYAPMLSDIVIAFVFALILITVSATVFSIIREKKHGNRITDTTNSISDTRISMAALSLTVISMVTAFAAGSSNPLSINGTQYTKEFWLKGTDMFICTIIVLISAALIILVAGNIRNINHAKRQSNNAEGKTTQA